MSGAPADHAPRDKKSLTIGQQALVETTSHCKSAKALADAAGADRLGRQIGAWQTVRPTVPWDFRRTGI